MNGELTDLITEDDLIDPNTDPVLDARRRIGGMGSIDPAAGQIPVQESLPVTEEVPALDREAQLRADLGRSQGLDTMFDYIGVGGAKMADRPGKDLEAHLKERLMARSGKAGKVQAVKHVSETGKPVYYDAEGSFTRSAEGVERYYGTVKQVPQSWNKAKSEYEADTKKEAASAKALSKKSAEDAKRVAKKSGQQITAGEAAKIGKLDSANKLIDDLWSDYKTNASHVGSGLLSKMPWGTAHDFDQTRRQKAQMIGGILEGGKLTDPDFDRYYSMMPSPWDTDQQAKNKIDELKQTLSLVKEGQVKALTDTGFDTSGIKDPQQETAPPTIREIGGVKYKFDPVTKKNLGRL